MTDILPPLINSGAEDRSKASDSTSPQTFIVEDKYECGVGLVEFLARGAGSERDGRIPCSWCNKGIVTFYSDDHSQTAKIAVHKRRRASEHVFQKRYMFIMSSRLWVQL